MVIIKFIVSFSSFRWCVFPITLLSKFNDHTPWGLDYEKFLKLPARESIKLF